MALLSLPLLPARAEAPEVVSTIPENGDVVAGPPTLPPDAATAGSTGVAYGIQLCFSRPVDIRDAHQGGDFAFRVTSPSGSPLGLRIVFQPDGLGVVVYTGPAPEPREGEWTMEWRVRDAQSLEESPGALTFTVDPAGQPPPPDSYPPCADSNPPAAGPATPPAGGGPTAGREEGADGPDILPLALITTGAVLGAALLGLLLYVVRLRLGFWMHRPPPRQGGGEPH